MPVPKRKRSKRCKRQRAAHRALTPPNVRPCSQCNEPGIPHRVCPNCGFYKGHEVFTPEL
ncbi:MAG TPA: 50S ribosomal protein L32 [Bdellovibrionota bacterium]|nr:50S ribosomal protein L32 [Bdellovibrionota bacterium]